MDRAHHLQHQVFKIFNPIVNIWEWYFCQRTCKEHIRCRNKLPICSVVVDVQVSISFACLFWLANNNKSKYPAFYMGCNDETWYVGSRALTCFLRVLLLLMMCILNTSFLYSQKVALIVYSVNTASALIKNCKILVSLLFSSSPLRFLYL